MKHSISKYRVALYIVLTAVYSSNYGQQKAVMEKQLTPKQESIIPIAGFTAKGNQAALKLAMAEGLAAGLSVNEIKEILVQLYAYTGFPRSLNAISTLESLLNERNQKGIKDLIGKEPARQDFKGNKFTYGKEVVTKLTGSSATGAPQKFVPVIDTFLKEHLFADIFGRDNLDYQSREIATISALASLDGLEAQLRGHLSVGKNVGLTQGELRGIANRLFTKIGKAEGNTTTKILNEMYPVAETPDANPDIDLFSKGSKMVSNNFTGEVWLNTILQPDTTFHATIGNVTFSPGARSNWHFHPSGQILLVMDGMGFYQEKGKPKRMIRKGDMVTCEPNIIHWHGATQTSTLTHIAMSPNLEKGNVVWLEKVTDEVYNQ